MSTLAFILHSRPYKETSALVDLLTPAGRLTAVLRGARGKKGSVARPFYLLEVELKGRSELKTLSSLEPAGQSYWLQGERLFCALYLNELLMRMLPVYDPQPTVFEHYELTLHALAHEQAVQPLLRTFEWRLLEQLGYGFSLTQDIRGLPIDARYWYALLPDAGFERLSRVHVGSFLGADLRSLAATQWQEPQVLQTAKRLMRQALAPHLGQRPLMSRELFLTQKELSS